VIAILTFLQLLYYYNYNNKSSSLPPPHPTNQRPKNWATSYPLKPSPSHFATDSQPVCLGAEPPSGTSGQILCRKSDCYSVSRHVASSLTRWQVRLSRVLALIKLRHTDIAVYK
jgi:hypothetical protein